MRLFAPKPDHVDAPQPPAYEPGTYVGRAVFEPVRTDDLRDDLRHAIGRVVDLVFVTVAGPGERCAGQNIYMERPTGRSVLRGAWVTDEDVRFIDPSTGTGIDDRPRIDAEFRPAGPLHALATGTPLVLLVDDNRDTRELYTCILTHEGFQVVDAEDGETAIELTRSARPDVVVMDIDLPRVSGLDAIRALRTDPGTSHTPILAFTAHGAAMAAEAMRAGATTYCLKPCLPETFVSTLRSILPIPSEVEQVRR